VCVCIQLYCSVLLNYGVIKHGDDADKHTVRRGRKHVCEYQTRLLRVEAQFRYVVVSRWLTADCFDPISSRRGLGPTLCPPLMQPSGTDGGRVHPSPSLSVMHYSRQSGDGAVVPGAICHQTSIQTLPLPDRNLHPRDLSRIRHRDAVLR